MTSNTSVSDAVVPVKVGVAVFAVCDTTVGTMGAVKSIRKLEVATVADVSLLSPTVKLTYPSAKPATGIVPVEGVAVNKLSDHIPALTATELYINVVPPETTVTFTVDSLKGAFPSRTGLRLEVILSTDELPVSEAVVFAKSILGLLSVALSDPSEPRLPAASVYEPPTATTSGPPVALVD